MKRCGGMRLHSRAMACAKTERSIYDEVKDDEKGIVRAEAVQQSAKCFLESSNPTGDATNDRQRQVYERVRLMTREAMRCTMV